MTDSAGHPVVLFDGVCNLCNGAVLFIIRRDPQSRFRFASLQSAVAGRLLAKSGVVAPLPDSFVLIDDDGAHLRSTAALRIGRGLSFPWRLASLLVIVPRPIRDWVYDVVARYRYRWFGTRDVCMVPTPELSARFLSD